MTEEFWHSRDNYECATSSLGVEELRQTSDLQLRSNMESLLTGMSIIAITDQMSELAAKYMAAGAFSGSMRNDAVHVATATVSKQDVLVSWNFRHLVNRRRRAMVCEINASLGLPAIDILSRPEL